MQKCPSVIGSIIEISTLERGIGKNDMHAKRETANLIGPERDEHKKTSRARVHCQSPIKLAVALAILLVYLLCFMSYCKLRRQAFLIVLIWNDILLNKRHRKNNGQRTCFIPIVKEELPFYNRP